jgi:hypothetical protein
MKRMLGYLSVFLIAATLFIMTKSVNKTSVVSLSDIASLNTANAECQPPGPGSLGGQCITIVNMCFASVGYDQCDPLAPNN